MGPEVTVETPGGSVAVQLASDGAVRAAGAAVQVAAVDVKPDWLLRPGGS